jgi:hypothetical protein
MSPVVADTVAKVENRTTLKISRKPMFRRFYRCNAREGRYEGPWSFWCKTMWSLTSPVAERISGPEKFRSSARKDFYNNIGTKQTCRRNRRMSEVEVSGLAANAG